MTALAQQPASREAEPKLDAHDPASGELVAQWLFRNDLRELAAVVRAQLDMRAQQPAAVDEAIVRLAKSARELQRKNYGSGCGLHLDMIDWAREFDAIAAQPQGDA